MPPVSFPCPECDCWEALVGTTPLPAGRREQCERHLESCAECQDRLDRTEECEGQLVRLGRQVGDPTLARRDRTLVEILEQLREGKWSGYGIAAEPADLYFLQPTGRAGLLGTLGTYEVLEVIGQGGMGVVLKAFEPALNRLVAIKAISPAVAGSVTARRRFAREAQSAASVCHEHVVAVHGVHEAGGLPYLVMQYIPGESLQGRLDRVGPLEVFEVVRIGLQTASGLAAAHARGLIHRDIKPANILLEDGQDKVKITDFGLARLADDAALTQPGIVAGTPEFMAPEQARGEAVDHRADLFSLGSVLYAMCSGHPPFRASTTVAVLRQVSDQDAKAIREVNRNVPKWLEAVIDRLMRRDPEERFQSASEVAGLLEGYLAHLRQPDTVPVPKLPPLPGGVTPDRPTPRTRPRRTSPRVAALVALMVLALGISLWLQTGVEQEINVAEQKEKAQAKQRPEGQRKQDHLVLDFRAEIAKPSSLSLFGPDAETVAIPDAQGLRFRLPAGRTNTDLVGLELNHRLGGDFAITLGYDLMAVGTPAPRYGAGVVIRVWFAEPSGSSVILSRMKKPLNESFGAHRIIKGPDGKDQYIDNKDDKANRSRGKLRLIRTGPQLHYLVEEQDRDFREMQAVKIGTSDVEKVTFCCTTMYTPISLDARFTELEVRADTIHNLGSVPPESAPVSSEPVVPKGSLLVVQVVGGVVTLVLLGLGVWLALRRRGPVPAPVPAPVPVEEAASPAPAPISFACPGCGKTMKAPANLAGKRGKCRHCGRAVLVPAAEAGEPETT